MRVLFVCLGNICRSPTAEGVFRHLLSQEAAGLEIEVDSAGTGTWHLGQPPDKRARAAAQRRGIDLSYIRARAISTEDFERFDWILAMDEDNYGDLWAMCPPDYRQRIRLFMEFAPDAGARSVPDPYYGGPNGFERVLDLVEEAARGLLEELKKNP